jgi:hypothetical protein
MLLGPGAVNNVRRECRTDMKAFTYEPSHADSSAEGLLVLAPADWPWFCMSLHHSTAHCQARINHTGRHMYIQTACKARKVCWNDWNLEREQRFGTTLIWSQQSTDLQRIKEAARQKYEKNLQVKFTTHVHDGLSYLLKQPLHNLVEHNSKKAGAPRGYQGLDTRWAHLAVSKRQSGHPEQCVPAHRERHTLRVKNEALDFIEELGLRPVESVQQLCKLPDVITTLEQKRKMCRISQH